MSRHLVNVYLGGRLGQKLGEKWRLNVASPHEALRAIDINTRGEFRRYLLSEGKDAGYQIALQEPTKLIEAQEWVHPCGVSDIYVLPALVGSNSGGAKIVIGALILAAVLFPPAAAALGLTATTTTAAGATVTSLTTFGSIAAGIGTSLVLGGVAQLLAPNRTTANGTDLGSNYFQGSVAGGQQGGCVPVVYGRGLVSPLVISLWFNNVDFNTSLMQYVGTSEAVGLPGGGTQFVASDPTAGLG